MCFTFECPDWEKVREDEKMGFIMSEWGLEGASLRLVGHGGHGTEGSRLSFPEEEPPCDALLLLELRAVWFNFAAPPRTTNSHRADFTRSAFFSPNENRSTCSWIVELVSAGSSRK